jgi:Cdc6-like AAA superfamily ATPase
MTLFDYMTPEQTEQYSYIYIPRSLMTKDLFVTLSVQAKVLYGFLLDRMNLARKYNWIDEKKHVYVVYPVSEMQRDLNASRRKILDCLSELESFGLIEREKQGRGFPNHLYIKNFAGSV